MVLTPSRRRKIEGRALLGEGEHGLAIDLGLDLLAAGDPQEKLQDLLADLGGALPAEDGPGIEVDVVCHSLVELRGGGNLDHRYGGEPDRGAPAGGEQDD